MALPRQRYHGQTVRRTQGTTPKAPAQPSGTQVTLDCNHSLFFHPPVPEVGSTIYCRYCQSAVTVKAVQHEIRIKCTECRYGRGFGQAMLTAETYASKHGSTKNHTVAIKKGDEVIKLVHEHQQPGLMDSGEPPF